MKYKTKDIKKLGRTYGKRKFKLVDVDAQDKVVLDMIEEAYLAGFKNGQTHGYVKCHEDMRQARLRDEYYMQQRFINQ